MLRIVLATIVVFALLAGCTGYVGGPIIKARQDMDDVVAIKGVPTGINEAFIGGRNARHQISLYYSDALYIFQTDAAKNYTVLITDITVTSANTRQEPIPRWFKARYPNLRWEGIPAR